MALEEKQTMRKEMGQSKNAEWVFTLAPVLVGWQS